MATPRPLRLAPEWDERFMRMVAVSAVAHGVALVGILFMVEHVGIRPLPPAAYTVELTDPSALGGRVPPGPPARDLTGGDVRPPAPEPKGESPAPPAPAPEVKPEPQPEPKAEAKPEPKPEPEPVAPEAPAVHIPEKPKPPEPKPEPKKVEPPKPEPPKPEAKKPEPPKPEAKKPEPPKVEAKKPESPKPPATPATPPKAAAASPTAKPGTPAGAENAPPRDAYAAAAERWRARTGGGLGGTDEGTGPIGSGGEGRGGGGEVVGLEFIAYKQQVINAVRASWTNLIGHPGLVAVVTFEIAPDGGVSNARLSQSSGNSAYDASALRAVQHTTRLPPPPARYVREFREFIMRFNSEDPGGQGAG